MLEHLTNRTPTGPAPLALLKPSAKQYGVDFQQVGQIDRMAGTAPLIFGSIISSVSRSRREDLITFHS